MLLTTDDMIVVDVDNSLIFVLLVPGRDWNGALKPHPIINQSARKAHVIVILDLDVYYYQFLY